MGVAVIATNHTTQQLAGLNLTVGGADDGLVVSC